MRKAIALTAALLLASCGKIIPPTTSVPPVPPPTGTTALTAGVRAGPQISSLGLGQADAATSLASFRVICARLLSRNDGSGLTRNADWKASCDAAARWSSSDAPAFFTRFFEAVQIGNGNAHATGYYEPEIAGVSNPRSGYSVPVYRMPPDLVRAKPGDAPALPSGKQPFGRYDAGGRFVPYYDRAQIDDGALEGKGLEIAWAADPVEFAFLQIQGSGRLRAPDGSVMRIGYGGQNGHPWAGLGKMMRDRGLIGSGPGQVSGSMQGIMQWLRANPEEGREMMRADRSYVFFRELTGDGPLGALGVPVRASSSVAADPKFVPLGAPIWLRVDRKEASSLWIAQDTGGAIKGANRFDTFWGAGQSARTTAGGMSARGSALVLLPKGTLDRLGAR
jgi:membrane-bound lytic murein transglycosylase A